MNKKLLKKLSTCHRALAFANTVTRENVKFHIVSYKIGNYKVFSCVLYHNFFARVNPFRPVYYILCNTLFIFDLLP